MLKGRTALLFAFALTIAGAATMLANDWITSQTVRASDTPRSAVVTAAVDIPLGQRIEAQHLKLIETSPELAPKGVVTATAELVGKVANQPVMAGEILYANRFTEHLAGSTLAALIDPKMRAMTVRVNDVIGVAGFLLPGNRVDVISTKHQNRSITSATILKNIKVLAVDQKARTDKSEPVIVRAVTLEVSPRQAEHLVKARDEGSIQLTLRNPLEEDVAEPVAQVVKRAPVRRAPTVDRVTVIRGVKAETTKVQL